MAAALRTVVTSHDHGARSTGVQRIDLE
jgi:hypothetical protein